MSFKKIAILSAAFASLFLLSGCTLDLGENNASTEVDPELKAAIDASAAADAAAAAPSSTPSSSSSSSGVSSSSSSGGSGGFIWKPVSESNGNLVVLLPSQYRGKVSSCKITKGGKTLESGSFSGDTHNGNRPHYRFSKPGAGYGSGLTVVAATSSGNKSWSVPNGSKRTEY